MSDLDALPPDQRAALQLLLKQGQSYEQLGELLAIDADSVRRRAHAALDTLGADAGARLSAEERAQVADYLLGQQTVSQRERARELLSDSGDAREWAQGLASTLGPLAPDALPDVPSAAPPAPEREPAGFDRPPARVPLRDRLPTRERAPRRERRPAGFERAPGGPAAPSSRLGGALLLGGVAILVAVLLIAILGGGDDDGRDGSTLSTRPATQTGTNANRPVAQINLFAPGGGTRTVGLAQVYRQGNRTTIVVAGQGLSPGAYALWLYTSRADSRLLGFVPERVGRDGRFATQGQLPANAQAFRRLVVTRENVTRNTRRPPARPGTIVLQGDLRLR
jgi:hypothetical protein